MKIKTLALALAVNIAMTGTANAAAFTKTYVAKTTYDQGEGSGTAPFKNVTQQFTIQFDPNNVSARKIYDYSSDVGGVLGLSPDSLAFTEYFGECTFYFKAYDSFTGFAYGAYFVTNLSGEEPSQFRNDYQANNNYFSSQTSLISIVQPAVPEPATWAMMLVGFGLIGATTRYRRKGVQVRYA